jgi:hypothetical protein
MKLMRNRLKGAFLLTALCVTAAVSVSTEFWSTSTYEEFRGGNFSDISLNREGAVELAPALEEVFTTDQAVIWSVARDPNGGLYLGTGHGGRVYRLGQDLQGSLFFDASEPDIFALAVDRQGNVYVGTSPDGKVYKVDASGRGEEFFDPQARYIWSLTFGADGALFVGTGDLGRIYRVQPDGQGELYYDTEQSHVVSLGRGSGDELIAGTEPNGLLYRISPGAKGFVIYDAPQSEIRSVLAGADGSIYAAAMGGPQDRRIRVGGGQQGGGQAPVRTATTITVRASEDSPLPGPGAPGGGGQQDPQGDANAQVTVQSVQPAGAGQVVRVGEGRTRNALLRVWPDSTVETLWDSTNETVFDVLVSGDKVLFSTDQRGRIYELTADRRVSLLTETGQGETTRLIPVGDYILAMTANVGKVFRLGTRPAAMGTFESEVKDAGTIAGWGQIRWTGEVSQGTSLELYTRSGNSSRPDATWSEWSQAYRQANGEQISSPSARYLQWKAVLRSSADRSPVVREVIVAYLPRNRSPEISDIRVTPRGDPRSGGGGQQVTIVNAGGGSQRGFSGVGATRGQNTRGMDIRWTAGDPDGDELSYSLYFRGEAETEWKLLEENVRTNSFTLEDDVLPDGRYRLKVAASDAGANASGTARNAETFSAPFLVDGTPPLVEDAQTSRGPGSATARFLVRDAASVLTRAEFALDADPLKPLLSEDGIIDSQAETFTITVSPLDDREHLVTVRVYDAAGNVGVGKAVWSAAGGVGNR